MKTRIFCTIAVVVMITSIPLPIYGAEAVSAKGISPDENIEQNEHNTKKEFFDLPEWTGGCDVGNDYELEHTNFVKWKEEFQGQEEFDIRDTEETQNGYIVIATKGKRGSPYSSIVAKFDEDMARNWKQKFTTTRSDPAVDFGKLSTVMGYKGGYLVAGIERRQGGHISNIWVIRLTKNGGIIWNKKYNTTVGDDWEFQRYTSPGLITRNGNIIVGAGSHVFKLAPDGTVLDENDDLRLYVHDLLKTKNGYIVGGHKSISRYNSAGERVQTSSGISLLTNLEPTNGGFYTFSWRPMQVHKYNSTLSLDWNTRSRLPLAGNPAQLAITTIDNDLLLFAKYSAYRVSKKGKTRIRNTNARVSSVTKLNNDQYLIAHQCGMRKTEFTSPVPKSVSQMILLKLE